MQVVMSGVLPHRCRSQHRQLAADGLCCLNTPSCVRACVCMCVCVCVCVSAHAIPESSRGLSSAAGEEKQEKKGVSAGMNANSKS